ncbi:hypothetical protein ACFL0V_00520 [Nanoarchaeota archaeon]
MDQAMMSTTVMMIGYTLGAFGASLFFFWKAYKWIEVQKIVGELPTSKVRGLAMGIVEIYGKVIGTKKMIAPMSGKECIFYDARIQQLRKGTWADARREIGYENFFLKDATGKVLVNPDGAEFEMKNPDVVYQGKSPTGKVMAFRKDQNMKTKGWLTRGRYIEYRVEEGDKVYILGNAGDNPDVAEGTGQKNTDDIMIQKGSVYIISDHKEKDMPKALRYKYVYFATFGVVCLVMSGYLFWAMLQNI